MASIMSQNCNKALEKFEMRCSAAYPTGAERIISLPRVTTIVVKDTTIVVVLMHEIVDGMVDFLILNLPNGSAKWESIGIKWLSDLF